MVGTIRLPSKIPAALFAVVVFSLIATVIDASARGVSMVGAFPSGLPSVEIPTLEPGEVARLAATAASISVVILAQSAAVARSFGQKNGYRVSTNADLAALSAANAGSAVTGGFAINGSPPRTSAGDSAGSRTQLVNLVMALVIAAVLLFAAGLFDYVPEPVLDAVVLGIGIHLIKVPELRRVARTRRVDLWIALLAVVVARRSGAGCPACRGRRRHRAGTTPVSPR
jgi:MFS superfamily sulfate permease-like transporter